MRKIRDLIKTSRTDVWFSLCGTESRKAFFSELKEEGFKWKNGKPIVEEDIDWPWFALSKNGTVSYVSGMTWQALAYDPRSFADPLAAHIERIDYQKFHDNLNDYLIKRKHHS